MLYDAQTEGECPTLAEQFSDAAVPVGGCHETPGQFGDVSRFPADDEQTEREYLAWAEAEAAVLCVASGRPVVVRAAPVYFRDVVADGAKWRASVIRDGVKVPVPGRFNTFDGADAMAAMKVRAMQDEDMGGKAA